jgi:hypothetical protein
LAKARVLVVFPRQSHGVENRQLPSKRGWQRFHFLSVGAPRDDNKTCRSLRSHIMNFSDKRPGNHLCHISSVRFAASAARIGSIPRANVRAEMSNVPRTICLSGN